MKETAQGDVNEKNHKARINNNAVIFNVFHKLNYEAREGRVSGMHSNKMYERNRQRQNKFEHF